MNATGTSLQQAIRRRDLAAVRTLLRQRQAPDSHEVATAVRQQRAPALELLHRHGVDLSAPVTHTEQTPLHLAAHDGWTEGVVLLLRLDGDPGRRDSAGRTPLGEALLHGHVATSKRLLEAEPAAARELALSSAVVHGDPELVRALLDAGADPERTGEARVRGPHGNRVTESGRPLELAGSAEVVELLVAARGRLRAAGSVRKGPAGRHPDRAAVHRAGTRCLSPGLILPEAAGTRVRRLRLARPYDQPQPRHVNFG
jgi:ankyrin repeat protein